MKPRTFITRASREFADNPRGLSRAASEKSEGGIEFDPRCLDDPEFTLMFRVEQTDIYDPQVSEGDLVIADRRAQPVDGGLVIAMVGGEMVLRRYSLSGGLEVISGGINSTQTIEVTGKAHVEILAAVVSVIPVMLD